MRISEKAQQIEIWDIFYEWSKYYVYLYPPMGKIEKSKKVNKLILMNVQNKKIYTPYST